MAFMVGVGRYRGGFVMEQFFLRGPAEEAALLAGLENFCADMAAVVTYNGKSFDIPSSTRAMFYRVSAAL